MECGFFCSLTLLLQTWIQWLWPSETNNSSSWKPEYVSSMTVLLVHVGSNQCPVLLRSSSDLVQSLSVWYNPMDMPSTLADHCNLSKLMSIESMCHNHPTLLPVIILLDKEKEVIFSAKARCILCFFDASILSIIGTVALYRQDLRRLLFIDV